MKKLSIITINYNNKEGLKKTMESVFSQTFTDYEYQVVDGGSNDGSADLIRLNEKKIACWVSEKDRGIYHAQNKGMENATGEYCLFLNSGDFLVDQHVLQRVFDTKPSADIVYGDMLIDWGKGNITTGKMPATITLMHMYKDTLWHPVSFIKRELFHKYGKYDESYKIVADYDFFFRTVIVKRVSTAYLGFTISYYNTAGISSSPDHKKLEKEERERILNSCLSPEAIKQIKKEEKQMHSPFWKIIQWLNRNKN